MSSNKKKYQELFDFVFNRLETDFRELGYGDMSVNKKMKALVTKFYSILIDFDNFSNFEKVKKERILSKYFSKIEKKDDFIKLLSNYLSIDNTKYNDS